MKKIMLLTVMMSLVGIFAVATPGVVNAQSPGEVCIQGTLLYRVSFQPRINTFDISGVRFSGTNEPIAGSAYVEADGTVVIGFSEFFDYGTGGWIHPHGTTVMRFPPGGSGTYDTTYHGAGTPINVTGTATFVSCPSPPPLSEIGDDPNAR